MIAIGHKSTAVRTLARLYIYSQYALYLHYLLTGGGVHISDPLAVGEDCVPGDRAGLLLPAARRHVQLRQGTRLVQR